jgi:capsular exopolysaccharide synthesis family protein
VSRNLPARRGDSDAPAVWHPPAGGGSGVPGDGGGGDVDVRRLWAGLRRRRVIILFTTAFALAAAAALTFLSAPVWYASTLIRVDEKEGGLIAPSGLDALTDLAGGGEIETEMRMLRTRPTAELVVDELDLHVRLAEPRHLPRELFFASIDVGRETIEAAYRIRPAGHGRYRIVSADGETPPLDRTFSPGEAVEIPGGSFVMADLARRTDRDGRPVPTSIALETVLFQEAVEDLFEDMAVTRPDREANVIRVGYRTTDLALAPEVPNAMAETFIARRIESKKADARSTVAFLEDQVDDTRARLEAVEAQMQGFREGEQIVALAAEAEAQVQRLAVLQTQRTGLDTERAALAELLADIDGGADPDYRRLASFPTFFGNDAIAGILQELIEADRARTEALVRLRPRHPDVAAIDDRIAQLESQLASIGRNYLASLERQIGALDVVLDSFGDELERIPAREIRFARLTRQAEMLADLYTLLSTRLKEAEVAEAIDDSSVRVVEYAIEPLEPESPDPIRNLALAAVLGLLLGVLFAVGREVLDRRLQPADRIEELYGLPTMARIPILPVRNGRSERAAPLVTVDDAQSAAAESFRNLRTNVGFVRGGRGADRVVITSPGPDDGKSATAANLAAAMAQRGRLTVLVDADIRRPVQHIQFDLPRAPGLSECLAAGVLLEGAVRPTGVEGLHLLASGALPPNPAELLDSPRLDHLLDALRDRYDAIVVEAPPVLAVADTAVLAPRSDGVILVVRAGVTDKEAIALALEQLRMATASVFGVVVGDVQSDGSYREYLGEAGKTPPGGLKRLLRRVQGSA